MTTRLTAFPVKHPSTSGGMYLALVVSRLIAMSVTARTAR
jgi:hypothetical protein